MKSLTNMKVFLRNRETGQFYAGSTGWSGDSSVAHEFDTVEGAIELAHTQELAGVEVVLRSGDTGCELILPVKPRTHQSQSAIAAQGQRRPDGPALGRVGGSP
jgi:hypothetical protein